MNLSINGLPKVSFKSAAAANVQPAQQPQPMPQVKQDTFEKSDKTQTKAPEYSKSSVTSVPKYSAPGDTTTSIFYVADLHGKMTNMERICEMARLFDANCTATAKLKLSSGDILLGSNPMTNKVASHFLNWIGVTNNGLGNHELDAKPAALAECLKDAKYNLLAANVTVKPDSPMAGKIKKSVIEEYNGEKFGIIGTAPSDALERVGTRESLDDIQIDDIDTTIKKVQEEVNNLKSQKINKIIVVSHIGKDMDKRLAQETEGIDIILGAHTHDLYKGVKEGENLLYSKSGEPVVLTQIGKDGEYVGVLNAVFNKDGILTKVQNNVMRTGSFTRKLPFKTAVEAIIGKPEVLGTIKSAPPSPKDRLIANNPHGNIIVDAMKNELGTDIAILNAGNLRGFFAEGEVDSRRINDVTPFEDKMMICNLSEKQIVDALKVGAKSFINPGHKPGILLVSGLQYTVSDKGQLLDLAYIDKQGNKVPIDINNPSTTKKFSVACDDFFAYGGDDYLPVNQNPDYVVKKFDVDKNVYTAKYIKNHNGPIEIKEDDRIKIVKS